MPRRRLSCRYYILFFQEQILHTFYDQCMWCLCRMNRFCHELTSILLFYSLQLISHRLFPMARYSIWVDSKSQFRRDPLGVIEALLWRSNSSLALSEHGARSSLYDEGKAIVKKHKATPEEVKIQLDQYRQDGIPDDKRFNGKKG